MCKYSDDLDGYKCPHKSLLDSDYCIFHLQDDNKDVNKFNEGINELLKTEKDLINLNGFYFPKNTVLFSNIKIMEKINFSNASFSGDADFSNASFSEDADFSNASFSRDTDFSNTSFYGDADFFNTSFSRCVIFSNTSFFGDADFSSASFPGDANFISASFSGDANFICASFPGDANFFNASFSGNTDFSSASFSGDANFISASFSGDANFFNASFSGNTDFSSASFSGDVNFSSASFSGNTDFSSALFSGDAKFYLASFLGYADFFNASFSGDAKFYLASFLGDIDFFSVSFSGNTDFSSASFFGDTKFSSALFSGNADFSSALFSGNADFSSASFSKKVIFINVKINKIFTFIPVKSTIISFINAFFSDGVRIKANLSHCYFKNSNVDRADLTDSIWIKNEKTDETSSSHNWKELEDIYRRLKQSYQKNGDYSTAGEFYYREKECHRKQLSCLKNLYQFILFRSTCGYGEKPFRVILTSLVIVIMFAIFYYYSGVRFMETDILIAKNSLNSTSQNATIIKHNLSISSIDVDYKNDFLLCLYTSVLTFTTLGYGDLHPLGLSRLFASIEAVIGIFITALFIFVFTRKMLR